MIPIVKTEDNFRSNFMSQKNGRISVSEAKKMILIGNWVRWISPTGASDSIVVEINETYFTALSPGKQKDTENVDFDQVLEVGNMLIAVQTGLAGSFSTVEG